MPVMINQIQLHEAQTTYDLLVPTGDNSVYVTALNHYKTWLNKNEKNIIPIDFNGFCQYIIHDLNFSLSTAQVYLSALKQSYRYLSRNRDAMYRFLPEDDSLSPADKKAMVDEIVIRIRDSLDEQVTAFSVVKEQDVLDNNFIRLNKEQVRELLSLPAIDTLQGLRDKAMIAMFLATGIRESELTDLRIEDLHVQFGGNDACRIRAGKGNKQRIIPYGELGYLIRFVDQWIHESEIKEGYIFRRVYKGQNSVGRNPLSRFAVYKRLQEYPVKIDGLLYPIKPHDLRRTYAKQCYDTGLSIYDIQQNLGHEDESTTKLYIGNTDTDSRKPKDLYDLNNTDEMYGNYNDTQG